MQKTCNKCLIIKCLSEFSVAKSNKDGYSNQCKKCKSELTRNYVKTLNGKITQIYNSQIKASKDRGHPLPTYNKLELTDWLLKNDFENLFNQWVDSNYKKHLAPSVDRLDDLQGYSFDNIRLVTWDVNRDKIYDQRNDCTRITKQNRQVSQFTIEGEFIKSYPSIAFAARETNIQRTNINAVCTGKVHQAGGYFWQHST